MKAIFLLVALLLTINGFTQNKEIDTEISSPNIYKLSIIKIIPDSFPDVSVIFQAKNMFGKPLWNLRKEELTISENNQKCQINRLLNISENKDLKIALVFDHSGSMDVNENIVKSIGKGYVRHDSIFNKNAKRVIDRAKEGVINFLEYDIKSSDSILFVGFSETADKVLPLTNKLKEIQLFVDELEPENNTSFYDALHLAIDSLKHHDALRVIVALTDGLDNSSKYSITEIEKYALENNIPIYIIGFGMAETQLLMHIADTTHGLFYYTSDAKKLSEIYLNIKKQLKSIYQVDYVSPNIQNLQEAKTIRFKFINDTLTFSNDSVYYSLPIETLNYIESQEKKRKRNNLIMLGSTLFLILLLGAGSYLVYRKKVKPELTNVYPNPINDHFTVEYNLPRNIKNAELIIYDSNGTKIRSERLDNNKSKTIDASALKKGFYLLVISSSKGFSESVKVVKR